MQSITQKIKTQVATENNNQEEDAMKKKNIIFITADQLSASFVGCYGSKVPSTPTLDRLASQGMRFDRSYAHVPVCAPQPRNVFNGPIIRYSWDCDQQFNAHH